MPRLPYTNFHDINLNWFFKEFKKIIASVAGKQDKPVQAGTAGQVLGLNDSLQPVWVDQEAGTIDYSELENKPSINGVELSGNKTGSEYGLIDTPAPPGTAGQVLGLDESLTPKWIDQEGGSFDFDITGTASGAIASFDDGANNEPLQDLQIAIEPVQAGTGDPSPSNIRPISGWSGVNVTVAPTASADDPDKTIYPFIFPGTAGTVYGGTLNPVTGELVVTHAIKNLSEIAWSYYADKNLFLGTLDMKRPANNNEIAQIYCEIYKAESYNHAFADTTDNNLIAARAITATNGVAVRDLRFSDVSSFVTAMQTENAKFAYEMPTPITYTLTPTEIRTLLGANNIWADTGDILQCVYKVDPDIYIQNVAKVKILTPSENSIVLKPFPVTYNFGERTTLTLTATADTYYKFMFKCPSNAVTNITINGAADTAGDIPAAGKTYIVEIWAGIANYTELVLAVG